MHEYPSWSERTESRWDPAFFMSHHIWPTSPLERWDQGPNRVKTGWWGVHGHVTEDMLTETGQLVRVILVAVVCDKPAAHKMGGFASHSHTNFCSLCWISVQDKGKPSTFRHEGVASLSDSISYPHPPQHSAVEQTRTTADSVMTIVNYWLLQPEKTSSKSTQRDTRNFPAFHISI